MKKLFLSVMLIASAFTFTNAQTTYPDWSVALKGGLDYFRITPVGKNMVNDASWNFGATVERTVNPLVGYGLNLDYFSLNRSTVKGKTIDPTLFASVNLSNLFYPKRTSGKMNIYANFGAGASIYSGSYTKVKSYDTDYNDFTAVGYAGLAFEYNLNRSIALGAEAQYRAYARENLGGLISKDRNDDAVTAMVSVRFKLGDKSQQHMRTVTMSQFYPEKAPVVVKEDNPYDDSALLQRLDAGEKVDEAIINRLNELEDRLNNLKSQPAGSAVSVDFENIEFKFNSDKLTDASTSIVAQVANVLKANPSWGKLVIKGNTDNVGPEAYNLKLSEARANTVKEYLVSNGVSASIISTVGYGETAPIASNNTAEGRQKNRRVEFEITK